MAEPCKIEIGGLPVIDACPSDETVFFANNVEGGLGQYGYALFTWLMLKNCILNSTTPPYTPIFYQFLTVGDELTYTITPTTGYYVVEDSVNISLDGAELCRYTVETAALEKIMYTVGYEVGGTATINFYNAGAPIPAEQMMVIKYGIRQS